MKPKTILSLTLGINLIVGNLVIFILFRHNDSVSTVSAIHVVSTAIAIVLLFILFKKNKEKNQNL